MFMLGLVTGVGRNPTSSRAAEERGGWMGGKRSNGGKDTYGRWPVVGRPARQPPGRGGVGCRLMVVLLP